MWLIGVACGRSCCGPGRGVRRRRAVSWLWLPRVTGTSRTGCWLLCPRSKQLLRQRPGSPAMQAGALKTELDVTSEMSGTTFRRVSVTCCGVCECLWVFREQAASSAGDGCHCERKLQSARSSDMQAALARAYIEVGVVPVNGSTALSINCKCCMVIWASLCPWLRSTENTTTAATLRQLRQNTVSM